ncbi:hypothetical protein BKA64DRAFT_686514 [Cadophora sp. MPI-SDFR-AT-0126]|nr:hypothetical protein BKA64DRAFT_686514 [Leotiomycetes sp. MPI-SDFR-AT-0126]
MTHTSSLPLLPIPLCLFFCPSSLSTNQPLTPPAPSSYRSSNKKRSNPDSNLNFPPLNFSNPTLHQPQQVGINHHDHL